MGIGSRLGVVGLAAAGLAGCTLSDGVFRDRSALVTEPSACSAKRFDIYFDDGSARLTMAAREAIGLTATQLQGCEIQHVRVVGLADASGASQSNMTLSQRRARAVAEALGAAGWPNPAFDVTAGGDEGSVAESGVREPLRRRTEVLVEAAPAR
jgi:outer membrane protein OmpA-like peptidoglycan-associated protein